jgi:hypothetical protein
MGVVVIGLSYAQLTVVQLTVRARRWSQSGMPAGHLLEVYEGEFKGADYSTCERCAPCADPWPPHMAHPPPGELQGM